MARVHTAKARKDYPQHGIKKGDTYYYWQLYKSPKQMSLTRPRPSQLTGSDKLSRAYSTSEDLGDAINTAESPSDLVDALNAAAEAAREIAEEYRESKENMPEGLQESPTAQDCEEKADSLEAWADEMENTASDIETPDFSDILGVDEIEVEADEEGQPPKKLSLNDINFDDLPEGSQQEVMDHLSQMANDANSCPI